MTAPLTLHATTVAFDGCAVLLTGASGRGKSSLALQLMAIGAQLVADDQTVLNLQSGQITASCPPPLAGLIEARGLGLLNAPYLPQARLCLVVDLDHTEADRLPDHRQITLLGQRLSLVYGNNSAHFPSSLKYYVLFGRRE
ncbi:MAG: HPr kinase/phosphatase C-terminal domain-containing protein [Pseudotabrizicola sp.]|uniref:HPr kinase/phosphorylase n=1 Tax=Pseudotabrizicola sp. TaxID=2939647 RepID=UPI002715DC68|nr:HPr kinase/phosphatase C-terminal domain-containing protein [Pseudotabrizicola sp.]MDO8883412.1 HPr kinase/phosphatase C-terminal domain-containing protein [Pseudotabrizicola sp.]MDP2082346.1 HPr kinase/phosphatase C-terminal domain-containing protein [Pseudotabrizicola sp.]MDZ7574327.1 HPr kinase/phosphatase C-terminal domain-containing protein [Pseudotabrizicola sp.]